MESVEILVSYSGLSVKRSWILPDGSVLVWCSLWFQTPSGNHGQKSKSVPCAPSYRVWQIGRQGGHLIHCLFCLSQNNSGAEEYVCFCGLRHQKDVSR